MRHGEANALKDQADGERIRTPPLNSGESDKLLNRECACEPEGGARPHALEDHKPTEPRVVDDLDAAYADIPEAERDTWYERADQALAAAGMPEWMRITPTVKAEAVRMWLDEGASGVRRKVAFTDTPWGGKDGIYI